MENSERITKKCIKLIAKNHSECGFADYSELMKKFNHENCKSEKFSKAFSTLKDENLI